MQRSKNRRQTLGAVNVNQGMSQHNRRQSVEPGQAGGAPPKARPPRGRASMIPRVGRENVVPPTPPSTSMKKHQAMSSGRGRQSVGGDRRHSVVPPTSAPTKQDPRPISDKTYQQECIKKLLKFLQESGYELPISHKALSRPSGKDFYNIVTFMLRRVDPNFQDGTMKMEDEVAMNFRAMGYPFGVSKTALVAAGSPHTWPSLLAALTWLAERIECMENFPLKDQDSEEFDSLEELEVKTDKAFFKYLSAAYTAFLRGDEELTEQLENELADRFERDDGIIEQEIEQFTDRNAEIVERINNLSGIEKDLEDYIKKRDGYATDLEQFHDLIEQMEQHKETLQQKKEERLQEFEDTNRKLNRTNEHIEELKETISNQKISLEDVRKMQNELKGFEEAIDRMIILKDERKKTLRATECDVARLWDKLESLVSDYNSQVSDLNLLPFVSAKNIQMKASVDQSAISESDESKIVGVDIVSVVQPALVACKQEYVEKFSQSKWQYQEALDRLERCEEAFTEALERLKIVNDKIDKCEEAVAAERQAQDSKIAVREREAESMETRIGSLRDPAALEEQMAGFERQCAELEVMRLKYQEERTARKRQVCEEIEKAIDAMKAYDTFFTEKIDEVKSYRQQKMSKYGKLKHPPIIES